jgi:membrane protein YqaA with SNARE-associated domain
LVEEWIINLSEYFITQFGYFGVFLISFIGSVSIIFPIPYTLVIFALGSTLDPLFIAISGGLGAVLGEFSGYAIGYYGRAVVNEERRRKMDFMVKVFDKYGPISIFIFALTPLPDDLLFIPLGVMHYPFWRAFVPALFGKMLMTFILAFSGQQYVDLILTLFDGSGLIGALITIILLVIVIIAMIKIDWEKLFEKQLKLNKTQNDL